MQSITCSITAVTEAMHCKTNYETSQNKFTKQTRYSADSLCCCAYMWHQMWTGSVLSDDGICFNHNRLHLQTRSKTTNNI